jgi:hypothetical protein
MKRSRQFLLEVIEQADEPADFPTSFANDLAQFTNYYHQPNELNSKFKLANQTAVEQLVTNWGIHQEVAKQVYFCYEKEKTKTILLGGSIEV